jgi:hypothetical protein
MLNVAFKDGRDGVVGESPATLKIVFPERRGPQPRVGQTWICSLVRDTQPETKRRGAWIVKLVSLAERTIRWKTEIKPVPAYPALVEEKRFGVETQVESPRYIGKASDIPEGVDPSIRAQVLAAVAAREEFLSGWVWPEVKGMAPVQRAIQFKDRSFVMTDRVASENYTRLVRELEVSDLVIRKEIPIGPSMAEIVAELGRPTEARKGNWGASVDLRFSSSTVSMYIEDIPKEERRVEMRESKETLEKYKVWVSLYGLPEMEITGIFSSSEDWMDITDNPSDRRVYTGEVIPAHLSRPGILTPEDQARLTPPQKGLAYWSDQVAKYRTMVVTRLETVKADLAALGPEILKSGYESWVESYPESDDGYRAAGQYTASGAVFRAYFPSGREEFVLSDSRSGYSGCEQEKWETRFSEAVQRLRERIEEEIKKDETIVAAIDNTPPYYGQPR